MISFELFTMEDGSPIYVQILRFIKRGIVSGSILDGDALPSRRVLSSLLGINPNTVQKAYRMLEEEGLIASSSGAKSSMVLDDVTVARVRAELMESDILSTIRALKQTGLSKEEALRLIEQNWVEGNMAQ
ncbi:MAG: GntR family transcriptional regulator [Oscillospiraceae bacterium]|nr:GntR family transcriptional regulator [Oscillospiraceae bacterium]